MNFLLATVTCAIITYIKGQLSKIRRAIFADKLNMVLPGTCEYNRPPFMTRLAMISKLPNDVFHVSIFFLSLLSRTFTIHRTAGEGAGYFFNSSLLPPPAS